MSERRSRLPFANLEAIKIEAIKLVREATALGLKEANSNRSITGTSFFLTGGACYRTMIDREGGAPRLGDSGQRP